MDHRLRAPQIQKLAVPGVLQLWLFDEKDLAEIKHSFGSLAWVLGGVAHAQLGHQRPSPVNGSQALEPTFSKQYKQSWAL